MCMSEAVGFGCYTPVGVAGTADEVCMCMCKAVGFGCHPPCVGAGAAYDVCMCMPKAVAFGCHGEKGRGGDEGISHRGGVSNQTAQADTPPVGFIKQQLYIYIYDIYGFDSRKEYVDGPGVRNDNSRSYWACRYCTAEAMALSIVMRP